MPRVFHPPPAVRETAVDREIGVEGGATRVPEGLGAEGTALNEELHGEIYTYFKWLELALINDGADHNGDDVDGRDASTWDSNLDPAVGPVRSVLVALSDLPSISAASLQSHDAAARDLRSSNRRPLLERLHQSEMRERRPVPTTWEERLDQLRDNVDVLGMDSYAEMNRRVKGLGDWVKLQRAWHVKNDPLFMASRAPLLEAIEGFEWQDQPKSMCHSGKLRMATNIRELNRNRNHNSKPPRDDPSLAQATPVPAEPGGSKQPPKKRQNRPHIFKRQFTDATSYDFDTEFERLMQYREEQGDFNPPSYSRLGKWTYAMREKFKQMGGSVDENGNVTIADPTGVANADLEAEGDGWHRLECRAPTGKLGLSVKFVNDDEPGRAEITAIHDSCPFKRLVRPGDRIYEINGKAVDRVHHLKRGEDKPSRLLAFSARESQAVRVPEPLLTEEQVMRLHSAGFNWEGYTFRSWGRALEDLVAYKREHGHTSVPYSYRTPGEGFRLGDWVKNQRADYRYKKPNFMKDRAPRLDAIGFEWRSIRGVVKATFESRFQELVRYKEEHGHANITYNNSVANPYRNLGRWARRLRLCKQRKEAEAGGDVLVETPDPSYLTPERIQVLESIGFDWTIKAPRSNQRKRKADPIVEDQYEDDARYDEWGE